MKELSIEGKELLLKDLCARLPYGVKLQKNSESDTAYKLYSIDLNSLNVTFWKYQGKSLEIGDIGKLIRYGELRYKPYLRPLSSMTEEEDMEWQYYKNTIAESCDERLEERISELHDWFAAHHFDYRGLIEKDLAIEAPEEMYK